VTRAARDGVLPVDKPVGPTSHDVVAAARRALNERRVGHTGTLDPFASGLLLLCVGRATRISEFLTGLDKSYLATARLGIATDSEDREGEVVAESEGWRQVGPADLEAALQGLTGRILQVPPRFSAKKVDGEAAHRRARRGEDVALDPRPVTVHELEVLDFQPPSLRFRIRCSSGTYVRSVARDLGEALGVGAHLTELRRTAVGPFGVEGALGLEELEQADRVQSAWISPLEALAHLPRLEVDEPREGDLTHGRSVPAPGLPEGGPALAARGSRLVAVGEVRHASFRPRKVFA
jgi:tRNA pseudouridine55 synthase